MEGLLHRPPRILCVGTHGNSSIYDDKEEWRERADMNSIGSKLTHMLEQNMCLDVTFLVGSEQMEISCHKLVLVAASNVFMAMLTGDLSAKPGEKIEIPDIEPEAFYASIYFLYSGALRVQDCNLTAVLYTAVKYDLPHLLEACCEGMIALMDHNNALTMYQTAKFFKVPYLQFTTYKYIRLNPQAILSSADFLNLTLENVSTLISQSDFIAEDLEIFNAIVRWGEHSCVNKGVEPTGQNVRNALGECIYMIRFSRILPLEVSRFVIPKNIYTPEEMVAIFQCTSLSNLELDRLPPMRFPIEERMMASYRVKLYEDLPDSPSKEEKINFMKKILTFSADRDISIFCLTLFGLADSSSATFRVDISLRLFQSDGCWLPVQEFVAIGVKGYGCLRLHFQKPLHLRKYSWYHIVLETQATAKTTRGLAKGLAKVSCGESGDVTFFMDASRKEVDRIEFGFKI